MTNKLTTIIAVIGAITGFRKIAVGHSSNSPQQHKTSQNKSHYIITASTFYRFWIRVPLSKIWGGSLK